MRPALRLAILLAAALAGAVGLFLLLQRDGPAPDAAEVPGEVRTAPQSAPEGTREVAGDTTPPATPPGSDVAPSSRRAPSRGPVPTQVTGVVEDEEGRPIAGAEVSLLPVDAQALRGAPIPDGPPRATGTTDRAGTFALDAPPRGWLRVVASAAGHATGGALAAGAGAHVVIRLGPAGSLAVRVVDADGQPVGGAALEATGGDAPVRGVTGPGGDARLDALAAGAVFLTASAEGHATTRAGPFAVEANAATEVVIALARQVRLEGRVLDRETGQPVANAEVHVAQPGHAASAGSTAGDGTFGPVAAGGPGERVFVAVRAEGYAPGLEPIVLGPAEVAPQTVEVRIARTAPWTGRVEDGQGNGVEGALVTTTSDGVAGRAAPSATTDAEGRFTLPPPPRPAPGRRIVLVASRGAAQAARALHPDDPRPDPLVLVLHTGASVGGRIVDAEGKPVQGAQVRLVPVWGDREARRRPDGNTSRLLALNEGGLVALMGTSDEGGWWEVGGVPDGEYQLRVEQGGAPRWIPDVLRVSGVTVDAGTLALGKGLSLTGRVVAADGRPLAGARVHLTSAGVPPRAVSTQALGDGGFSFLDLGPGAYTLSASRPGFEEARVGVDLAASREVELELPAAPRLLLEVRESGAPYDGVATVTLERADRPSARDLRRTLEAKRGRIVVDDVPGGTWTVTVEAAGGRLGRAAAPVEVAPGEAATVAIDLASAAVLEGRVLAASGAPASGTAILLRRDRALRRSATTDPDGRYRIGGLAAGDYEVRVVSTAGAPVVYEVVLTAGERRTLDLALSAGGALNVRVLDAGGAPRQGVVVRVGSGLLPPDAPPWRTGTGGMVRVPHLPPGEVLLYARAADGSVAQSPALVVDGETREVELTLARPTR